METYTLKDNKACSTPGCKKAATMQCPSCLKLNLTPSFFCDQDCFKAFWPIHKLLHQKGRRFTKKLLN